MIKNNRTILRVMISLLFLTFLVACGDSTEESNGTANNVPQSNHSPQNEEDEFANDDSASENSSNVDDGSLNQSGPSNNEIEEDAETSSVTNEASLKDDYFNKLNDAKREAEQLEALDSSTFALKKVENDRWEIWDDLLNEIYGVLIEQLEPSEMDLVREEQRNWITYRDETALEASSKYKGGTQEHLEYVAVLANLTEDRCYELVEKFMR